MSLLLLFQSGGSAPAEGSGNVTGVGRLLGTGQAAEGAGQVLGIGRLVGAGQASEGTGDVLGVGTLVGRGQASEGAGSVLGIGFLEGEGATPAAEGGGSVLGLGVLSGAGQAAEGYGGISGIGFLSGEGQATEENPTGGGRSKRKGRRYPRRVMLRGATYVVRSWDEELSLLQAVLDRVEYHAAVEQTPELVKAAPIVRRRLKKVESARDKWLADLRRTDEELLILMM